MRPRLPIVALALFACATPSRIPPEGLGDSQLEISYVLGHDLHQLTLRSQGSSVTARASLNRETLKESSVDRERYAEVLQQVSDFVASAKRQPASQGPCRAPFTVEIRVLRESKKLEGCRNADQGSALSRITRDAEFLLYSKK